MSDYNREKKREIISLFAMFTPPHLNIMQNEAAITLRAVERGLLRSCRYPNAAFFFFFKPRESFQEVGYGKDVLL